MSDEESTGTGYGNDQESVATADTSDASMETTHDDPNNCWHNGQVYSPGDIICGADGWSLVCHNGRWEGTGHQCSPGSTADASGVGDDSGTQEAEA